VAWAAIGLDGFRLDAVTHRDRGLTDLRARLAGEATWDQPFYLVGETFEGDRGVIKQYVNPTTCSTASSTSAARQRVAVDPAPRRFKTDLAGFLDSTTTSTAPARSMSTSPGKSRRAARDPSAGLATVRRMGRRQGPAWQNQPQLPQSASAFSGSGSATPCSIRSRGADDLLRRRARHRRRGRPHNRHMMPWSGYTANQTCWRDQSPHSARSGPHTRRCAAAIARPSSFRRRWSI
jgi:hypothetical protein